MLIVCFDRNTPQINDPINMNIAVTMNDNIIIGKLPFIVKLSKNPLGWYIVSLIFSEVFSWYPHSEQKSPSLVSSSVPQFGQ